MYVSPVGKSAKSVRSIEQRSSVVGRGLGAIPRRKQEDPVVSSNVADREISTVGRDSKVISNGSSSSDKEEEEEMIHLVKLRAYCGAMFRNFAT